MNGSHHHRVLRTGRVRPASILLALMACTGSRSAGAPVPDRPSRAEEARVLPQEETLRPGLTARRIARETWVVTHVEAHSSNVLVARMADGTVLLASSPFDADSAKVMVDWIRERWAPERMVAINTHWHLDGTAGNAAYRDAGVDIYASTHTQALSLERGPSMREDAGDGLPASVNARVRATPVVPANHTFEASEGLTLTLGGEPVKVVFPGPAHSRDNVVVWLPERGVLFGGCMLKLGNSLGNLGDASVPDWSEALLPLASMAPSIVVPGHGPTGGPEIIANTQRLVREALARQPDALAE